MADVVTNVNQKIMSSVTGIVSKAGILKFLGWLFAIILAVGGGFWVYIYYKNKKLYNKTTNDYEIINGYYQYVRSDKAKVVKLGTGGFAILFLKKAKTWRLGYGGRSGLSIYNFYILPDGYPVNGVLSGDIRAMDKNGGTIQVMTTNPSIRAQYTSLEKQINELHQNKTKFWEQYGNWILSLGFVLVAGVMLYLNYQQYANAMGSLSGLVDKIGVLIDRTNNMVASSQGGSSGLIPTS